jgi:hypothetical protein
MEGINHPGLGKIRGFGGVLVVVGLAMLCGPVIATAQTPKIVPVPPDRNPDLNVQENVNVTGTRAPFAGTPTWVDPITGQTPGVNRIYNNGQLARQENEPSCGINPLNKLNILCSFNWYGFADRREQGDAWIGFSESLDGRTFTRRPLTGYNAHKNPIGKEFAADPTMLVFPGGAMVTFIAGDRSGNSVMVVQRMMEVNREYGFRHVSEERLITIESLGGVHFIDKPDAQIMIKPNGGFSKVTMTLEEPVDHDNDPSTPPQLEITRDWPNFRVVVSFADFGGSGENIRTWSTYSDDFGVTWSNKRQISNTSGLDQGLSIEDKGDDLLYVFRRFDSGENRASIMGALSGDRGERIGKVFEITDICDFDMITSPSDENPNRASVRSNAFPWLSATDTHFVLAYVERPRDGADGLTGNCLNSYVDNPPGDTEIFDGVAGTRVVIRTSRDGKNWSRPEPVMPFNTNRAPWVETPGPKDPDNPVHFNFMPTLACGRGSCNVIYYSTLTESQTYDSLLGGSEDHWEKTGFVEDFNVECTSCELGRAWYRRFLDIFSTKITINNTGPTGSPEVSAFPERVSRYQIDFDESTGIEFERDWNPANILNYGGNSIPFLGDYIALAIEEWRKDNGIWVDNASPVGGTSNIGAAINQPSYFAAWTDNRRVRVLYDEDGSPLPLENPEQPAVAARSNITENGTLVVDRTVSEKQSDRSPSADAYTAEGEPDDNDPADIGLCEPFNPENPKPIQTRIKDAEIYGAMIEDFSAFANRLRLVSPAIAKNYLNPAEKVIQRGFVIGAQNLDSAEARPLALVIENQPTGTDTRASWRQLPFDPEDSAWNTAPKTQEEVLAEPLSTEYVTLFVVSDTNSPVTVSAYDYDPDSQTRGTTVLAQITVNGQSESGDLQDPGTTAESVLSFEIHNPFLQEPDWENLEVFAFNPNLKNPNLKNPNSKNTDYMDTNFKNPNLKNPNLKNTTEQAPNLKNPNLKNPNLKNPNLKNAAFVDVTYQVLSLNNTTTATNADFAYGGDELDGLDVEVIAWQADELDSLQDCDPDANPVITESKVIAAKSLAPNLKNQGFKNPNLKNLAPADIRDPFQGWVSFPLPPGGAVNTTVRIFCESEAIFDATTGEVLTPAPEPPKVPGSCEDLTYFANGASKLSARLGYNFWAQKANTGQTEIANGREQQIKDVVPPTFSNIPLLGPVEAGGPDGAVVTYTNPTAADSSDIKDPPGVECELASGSTFPIGTTTVICTATDKADPPNTGTVSFAVDVVDTTEPAITLLGDNPQVIEGGDPYTELGASAADIVDGDLSGSIVIDASAVNTSVPGSYGVTYDVSDTRGNNAATVTRTVSVVDTAAPVITLLGNNPQVIYVGDPYTELGATAADIVDGDLRDSIVINASSVDTTTVGSYVVTYNVSDNGGNPAEEVTRTVNVQFNISTGVSFGKNNIKAGSVLPFSWSWKDSAGNNVAIEPNTHRLTVRVISCSDPGCIPGSVVFLNPGNSGIQLLADLSYQSNWQTINEITGEDLWPGDYRATVELVSPAGKALQTQISDLITIRASSGN